MKRPMWKNSFAQGDLRQVAACSTCSLSCRLENWLESQGTCLTSQVLDDTGGPKGNGSDRPLTTVVEVSGEAFET